MSVEDAHFKQAVAGITKRKLQARIANEERKGCCEIIYEKPVRPEPAYEANFILAKDENKEQPLFVADDKKINPDDIIRLKMWVNPTQKCDWNRDELMVKQFSCLKYRAAMEIVGNGKQISVQFMCHKHDRAAIETAFNGQFEHCLLQESDSEMLTGIEPDLWQNMAFGDFYPLPPYSDLFTNYDELQRSAYTTLINALAELPEAEKEDEQITGFYQVVFEPVDPRHNWHANIKQLLNIQYTVKSYDSAPDIPRFAEQKPSDTLPLVSNKLESKSHNDKPFFAAAVRYGILDPKGQAHQHILKVSEMNSLFLHGGNLMRVLTDADYRKVISPESFREMFLSGILYRPGFILNSKELTGFVHTPPPDITEHISHILKPLETLPSDESLEDGVLLGHCEYADTKQPVCIPDDLRFHHAHIIGTTGTGKTYALKRVIQSDIKAGHGVAVIDPHGQLVWDIMELVPSEFVDKVIYFNPGDPDYIPVWNPFNCGNISIDRIAMDITDSFKSFVTGWGHRLEHLLRQAILGVLHLPGGSFFDVSNILRRGSDESNQLIEQILSCAENTLVKNFWKYDFGHYNSGDVQPVYHKLSAFMTTFTVQLMLSQKLSSFKLNDIMKTGKILLIDLSKIGTEVKKVLGCLILSLLNSTAMSRDYIKNYESLLPFHIHCDEAHMFVTDALEDIIAQVRKAKVSMTLAHQYMDQFERTKVGALTGMGSKIVFGVNDSDATQLKKAMLGKVEVNDLVSLDRTQAIARINNKIVRFKTKSIKTPSANNRDKIIENSRKNYYVPIKEAKRDVFSRKGYEKPTKTFDLSDTKLPDHDEF